MADFDIHYDPITVNNNPATVNLNGLDNIQQNLTLATPQPLKSKTTAEFVFPAPLSETKTTGRNLNFSTCPNSPPEETSPKNFGIFQNPPGGVFETQSFL